jgi:hypothetical protein
MRPDQRGRWLEVGAPPVDAAMASYDGPLDVDLEPFDLSLRAAGAQARLALRSRTQPTRYFETELRKRFVAAAGPVAPAVPVSPASPVAPPSRVSPPISSR